MDVDEKVNLTLSGANIVNEKSFKYLGILISDDLKLDIHLNLRVQAFEARLKLLSKAGLYNMDCGVQFRSMLINTYAKSLLTYGLELYNLNDNQLLKMSRSLTNKLKVMYDLSTRLKTSELLFAHRIQPFQEHLKQLKL